MQTIKVVTNDSRVQEVLEQEKDIFLPEIVLVLEPEKSADKFHESEQSDLDLENYLPKPPILGASLPDVMLGFLISTLLDGVKADSYSFFKSKFKIFLDKIKDILHGSFKFTTIEHGINVNFYIPANLVSDDVDSILDAIPRMRAGVIGLVNTDEIDLKEININYLRDGKKWHIEIV